MSGLDKLHKNMLLIALVGILSVVGAWWLYRISKGSMEWVFPVFTFVIAMVWAFIGAYVQDMKPLLEEKFRQQSERIEAVEVRVKSFHSDVNRDARLQRFKQHLFRIFKGTQSKLFETRETVIVIFGKYGKGKYAHRIDAILSPAGFCPLGIMKGRISYSISPDELLAVKSRLEQQVPDFHEIYFIRIPRPQLIVPVKMSSRLQQTIAAAGVNNLQEKDFDRALITGEIDIKLWLRGLTLTTILKQYGEKADELQNVLVSDLLEYLGLKIGNTHKAEKVGVEQFLLAKGIDWERAKHLAGQLVHVLKLIHEFIAVVEDNTYTPEVPEPPRVEVSTP